MYQTISNQCLNIFRLVGAATVMDNTGEVIKRDPSGTPTTPFDYGSGHINPISALNPGLVYDFSSSMHSEMG